MVNGKERVSNVTEETVTVARVIWQHRDMLVFGSPAGVSVLLRSIFMYIR